MNHDAIPEFSTATPTANKSSYERWIDSLPEGQATTAQPFTPRRPQHHPNCAECCGVGRCHWCLAAPEHGTLTSKGSDGFSYSACRAHLRYFDEAQRHAHPHAGVDLTDGLRDVDISRPSPMLR